MLTLYRLIDITSGAVLLDGLNVASIGLDALRSQLAIIPQDPVLFSGTIRYGLKFKQKIFFTVLPCCLCTTFCMNQFGHPVRFQEQPRPLESAQ